MINKITTNADRIWQGTWKNRPVYEYISNGIGVIRDAAIGELISVVSRGTVDQFTQLLLGDPKEACFVLSGNMFRLFTGQ